MKPNIILTGPESSGKTTLALALAQELNYPYHGEYAREYLNQLDRNYTLEDVMLMAKKQLALHQQAIITSKTTQIFDTDLLVYKVWLKEKYNQSIPWIEENLTQGNNNLYLLCDIDIKWAPDPLREHPHLDDRRRLFQAYLNFLKKNDLTFKIISGDKNQRLKNAVDFICQQK